MSSAAIVEVGKLLGVIGESLAATVAVATLFSLAVLGIGRAGERRGRHSSGGALAYGALATVCLLGCLAALVYGVAVTATK
jgi:hypothetical protein